MQVLVPCLIFLAVENVQLVRNEHSVAREVLDSTQFKNAVAKELLKKKLLNLESARQQDSLASFLKNGGKIGGLRNAPKSSFLRGDDPSRKQTQMANTFIASSNLLFGTKSQQRKSCNVRKQAKEGLDMGSLRQLSGFNEEGGDFTATKDSYKAELNELPETALKEAKVPLKESSKVNQVESSKEALNVSSNVDLVESFKKALKESPQVDLVELSKEALKESSNVELIKPFKQSLKQSSEEALNSFSPLKKRRLFPRKAAQDPISCYLSEPKKVTCTHKDIIYKIALPSSEAADDEIGRIVESIYRAVEGKTRSRSLKEPTDRQSVDSLTSDSSKKKRASDDYMKQIFLSLMGNRKDLPNDRNPVFIPLLIPMAQPKQIGYYPGLPMDPRQVPVNLSGVDALAGRNANGNGYGQFLVLPEPDLKPKSQVNVTEEEEKRRNWLALMATNGLVPIDNKFISRSLAQSEELQQITEDKDSNKLSVAETGEVLDKLLNNRQERDTNSIGRQKRKLFPVKGSPHSYKDKRVLSKVVQKLTNPRDFVREEKKGCPCPAGLCATVSKCTSKTTKCTTKCPVNLLFQLTGSSTCSTTCSTTEKCSTCPEGCQPIPTCSETTKKCSTMLDCCGESDLSRVAPESKSNEQETRRMVVLPRQTNHINWLPYSQVFRRDKQPEPHGRLSRPVNVGRIIDNQVLGDGEPEADQLNTGFKVVNMNTKSEQQVKLTDHNQITRSPPPSNSANQPPKNRHFEGIGYADQPAENRHFEVIGDANQPGARDSKPLLESQRLTQPDHNEQPKQNDKNKKHRDSFFARLRSKFLKGLPQNSAGFNKLCDSDNQDGNSTGFKKLGSSDNREGISVPIRTKAVVGTSIFKFNTKNHTFLKSYAEQNPILTDNKLEQMRQLNEQNQTQPSNINNINITIASIQPQPIVQGQLPNRTNQPNRVVVQCPVPSSSAQNCPVQPSNGRTCTVTKIWLCTQPTPKTPCENITQPSTCQTLVTQTTTKTTAGRATQTTTWLTTTTQPSTCQALIRTSATEENPCYIHNGQPFTALPRGNSITEVKPVSRNGSSEEDRNMPVLAGNQSPQPAVQDAAEEGPGLKSPPEWNQWQNPVVRTTNASNWPQPQPQQKEPTLSPQMEQGNPTNRPNNLQPQTPLPWQPPIQQLYPRGQPPNQQLDPLGQPPNQQLDPGGQLPNQQLDPHGQPPPMEAPNEYQPNFPTRSSNQWDGRAGDRQPMIPDLPNFRPQFPNQGETRAGYRQLGKPAVHYSEWEPYDERKWIKSNRTAGLGKMVVTRRPNIPNISEHLARLRRYLWKKSQPGRQRPS